jgi:hypothetical protein
MQLCGAKKKNGKLCRAFAGQGTEHPGVGTCRFHLGNTKTHQVSAVRSEAQRRAIQFGQPVHVEPTEALLAVLHLSAGHLQWIKDEIAATEDKQGFDSQVLMRMWDDERDRVARVAKAALDCGVAERAVKLAETYGQQLAQVLRAVFMDPELALTAVQHERLPDLLRRHLGALEEQRALVA